VSRGIAQGRTFTRRRQNRPFPREPIIKKIQILVAAVLASAVVLAQAQSTGPTPVHHFQAGIEVGAVSLDKSSKFAPSAQVSFGYRFNPNFAIEAVALTNLLIVRDGVNDNGPWEFEHYLGLRGVGYLPLDEYWELMGGAGAGQTEQSLNLDIYGAKRHRTDEQLSVGLMYRRNTHWSMGFEASTLLQTQAINVGLRGEIHF
jgi:hypothetical protein